MFLSKVKIQNADYWYKHQVCLAVAVPYTFLINWSRCFSSWDDHVLVWKLSV